MRLIKFFYAYYFTKFGIFRHGHLIYGCLNGCPSSFHQPHMFPTTYIFQSLAVCVFLWSYITKIVFPNAYIYMRIVLYIVYTHTHIIALKYHLIGQNLDKWLINIKYSLWWISRRRWKCLASRLILLLLEGKKINICLII